MEFKTSESMAKIYIKTGFWKPLFKSRLDNTYADFSKRTELEHTLRNQLFGSMSSNPEYTITKNKYPFNLGPGYEQYVIWLKSELVDITKIRDIVENTFETNKLDYHIHLNREIYRSIKSIYHYHMITKIHQPIKPQLQHLIIFNRHGNREPIMFFPTIEKSLGRLFDYSIENHAAELTDIGRSKSNIFGSELHKIYELSNEFVNNNCLMSSPFNRCIDTLYNIANGLNIESASITKSNLLRFKINDELKNVITNKLLTMKNSPPFEQIIGELNKKLGTKSEISPSKLYDFHSSMKCYEDMSINFDEIFGKEFIVKFFSATAFYYHAMAEILADICSDKLQYLIGSIVTNTIKSKINLTMCSTHDHLIFTLMKLLAKKNNFIHKPSDCELPEYLSNIRIEIWSDETRVYFNNWYLGQLL